MDSGILQVSTNEGGKNDELPMKNWQVLFYTAVLAIALTACARANQPQDQTRMQGLPNGHMNSSQLHNPDEIPGYHQGRASRIKVL